MQFYSAKLRLAGNPMNEVRGVWSAPEILILQYIHGVDALLEIKNADNKRINVVDYKKELKGRYDQALVKREQSIDSIFGALGQLPTNLPNELLEKYDIVDEDDIISVAKSATRKDKNSPTGAKFESQKEIDLSGVVKLADEVSMEDLVE